MRAFTMQDFLFTMSVLFIFLSWLAYQSWKEAKQNKKKDTRWPSAKYKRIVDRKLMIDYDPTEDIYNN